MEDIIAPLLAILVMVGSSLLRARSQKTQGGEAPTRQPEQKKSFMEYGRELIKQIEEMNQEATSEKKVAPAPSQETAPTVQADPRAAASTAAMNDQMERLRADLNVNTERENRETREQAKRIQRNIPKDDGPLQVERKTFKNVPIQKNLTPSGLQQSIVMAEVLGPPRAKKAHRPIHR
ncbi:hypothetical protein J0B03_07325 [Alkalibacter rhizosphaerae]|uniref:Uncharacterized protein n=1 Tax=Alkalibacter rhizosphaerae TaxID=2815577 RepID=A0A975AHM7_9FIRM|nr:hypothetical protein [Alkalibacter rhizosphaerae]QSX07645.1 hypothetical protein J0B03_07325 [Alkalibacter rhizosphaerae]